MPYRRLGRFVSTALVAAGGGVQLSGTLATPPGRGPFPLAVIQGMNHVLRAAPADRAQNLQTYDEPTLPLDSQAVSTIADFLLAP
ncbi:MAG: hypothetical protein WA431_06815 [Candidatus Cybelea sp.]